MALPIIPLRTPAPPQELEFSVSPYMGSEFWAEGVRLFHHWAAANFTPGQIYGDFELAEKLDVHRLVSDEWLHALMFSGSAGKFTYTGHGAQRHILTYGANEASGFSIVPISRPVKVIMNINGVDEYDPWTDRTHDNELIEAGYADLVIDKYYLVLQNEYFVVKRTNRLRDNNEFYSPLPMSEHPRYAQDNPVTGIAHESWRETIERRLAQEADSAD